MWRDLLSLCDRVAAATGWLDRPFEPAGFIDQIDGLDPAAEPGLVAGLGVLLNAYHREAELGMIGRLAAGWDCARLLRTVARLQCEERADPTILEEPIEAPIIITGVPRSGTTFLHELLIHDPANRVPRCWETIYPYPERPGDDARRRAQRVEGELRAFCRLAPELDHMHALSAEMPQECTEVTAHNFQSMRFDTTHHVPSYRRWLDDTGHRDAYRFHRRFLQHLQHQRRTDGATPPRWVLKCPDHVFALPTLREIYPDALLVIVHRDPERVLASVASLTEALRRPFTRDVDPISIGQQVCDRWALGTELMMEADGSALLPPERTLHLHYLSLTADPVAAVRAIYAAAGAELPASVARLVEDRAARERGLPRSRSADRLAAFGLDHHQLAERFAAYCAYFDIARERPRDRPGQSSGDSPATAPVPAGRRCASAVALGDGDMLLNAAKREAEL